MNRRRMSGHRVVRGGAPPGPTIRAPWAVYELAGGSGVDAAGNGPEADVTNSGPGKLDEGAFVVAANADLSFFSTEGSLGFWYHVQEGDLTFGGGGLFIATLGNDDIAFLLGSDGTNITLELIGATTKSETTPVVTTGWHHFSFSRTGNSTQFFANGVAVGSASNVVPNTSGFGSFGLSVNEGGGRHDQPVFAQVAYTAEEWAYIYNSGAGRAYSTWSITP
jgi:hypothetical protein